MNKLFCNNSEKFYKKGVHDKCISIKTSKNN